MQGCFWINQLSCPVERSSAQYAVQSGWSIVPVNVSRSRVPAVTAISLDRTSIRPPPPLVLSLLSGLLVKCGKGCGKLVRLDSCRKHIDCNCQSHHQQQLDSPSKVTLSDVLAKPVTTPATPAEVRVAGHLVRRMLDSEAGEQIVRVPTRGQVSFDLLYTLQFSVWTINTAHHSCACKWMPYL